MKPIKITTIGNSAGIVLTEEMRAAIDNAQKGDLLYPVKTPDGLLLRPYDEEFARQIEIAERIMHEQRDVLRELAKR